MTDREATWWADGGCCVACGRRWPLGADPIFGWSAHHVIRSQNLRQRHVPSDVDVGLLVMLCAQPCHERHTSRFKTVPLEALPRRVVEAASALGPWAEDLLRRHHPPAAA